MSPQIRREIIRPRDEVQGTSPVVVRTEKDSPSAALREAKTGPDRPQSFCRLDVEGRLKHAPVRRDSAAWASAPRAESGLPRNPCSGARLGPIADD